MLGAVGLIAQLANMAGMSHYSREHESDADRIGLLLMDRAGYDPREAAKVWTQLRAELAPAWAVTRRAAACCSRRTRPRRSARRPSYRRRRRCRPAASWARTPSSGPGRPISPPTNSSAASTTRPWSCSIACWAPGRRMPGCSTRAARSRRLRGSPGDAEQAGADLQGCAALADAPVAVHRSLGFVAQQRGDAALAKASFERYIALAPDASDAALIRSYLGDLPVASPS